VSHEAKAAEHAAMSRLAERELTPFPKTACVRILSSADGKVFRSHATGSLFAIGGLRFLVTAAHIFDDDPPPLWIENAVQKRRMTLVGRRWRVDDDGAIDLAFVQLGELLTERLEGMRFLTMQDVEPRIAPAHIFAVAGFPAELNISGTAPFLFCYTTNFFAGPTTGIRYDPSTDLLLKYDLSFSAGVDGTPAGMPDRLHGMSGCPVWMLDPTQSLDASSLRLVGVQTGTIPFDGAPHIKIVKATKFEGVLAWLVHVFPDLERVLRMYRIRVGRKA
jgi:hypothetical protein